MDNFNNKDFYHNNEWQSISTPVVKTEYSEPEEEVAEDYLREKVAKQSKHPVLTIQLTLSLCVLLFIFLIKFLSVPLYEKVMWWYEQEISKSIVYNFDFESLDFSTIFATPDEV